MFNNFFKFLTIVFLLVMFLFPQNSFAQSNTKLLGSNAIELGSYAKQIVKAYLQGQLTNPTAQEKQIVGEYLQSIQMKAPYYPNPLLSPDATYYINEDFTTATGTTPPTGWTQNILVGTELWYFDNPGGQTINLPLVAPAAIFDSDFNGSGGGAEDAALESPAFDATAATSVLLEWDNYFLGGAGGAIFVEVWNGTTWIQVYTTTTSEFARHSINITTNVSGTTTAQVRFRWTGDWSWYWIVDNVKVYQPDPTPNPATLLSPANGGTDVSVFGSLDWFYGGGTAPTGYRISFGTDNPPTNIVNNTDLGLVTTYTPAAALAGFTTYYWKIIPYNGAGDALGNVVWSFTTGDACPVSSLPYTEDFESSATVFPPLCWSVTGPYLWDFAGVLPLNGTSAIANFWDVSSGSSDLISVEYNSTGASAPKLTFDWAYATCGDSPDELDIYYSTDAGATWTSLLAMPGGTAGILNPFGIDYCGGYYFPASGEWSTMTINLPANTNKVKFTAVSGFGNLLWLDNVVISSTEFVDDFEAYTVGGQLACQNPIDWTTWSLAPCDPVEDAHISSNYAYSGTKSVVIAQGNDQVYLTGTKTAGKWYASFAVYIPATKNGYFNAQQTFTVDWGVEVFFDSGGVGRVENGSSIPFIWQENHWNQCLLIVDLNTSVAEFWFGPNAMTQKAVWDWTRGATQPNTLEGFDFYGAAIDDEAYYDDFRFSDLAPPILQPADEVGTYSIDMDYQYAPGTVVPMATVKNYGTDANSFDVVMTITGGYSSTKTVTALAPGASVQVTFDNWTAATVGASYAVNVCTQLTGDEDPSNNCQDQSVTVWDPDGDWTAGLDFPSTAYNGIGVTYNDGTTNWLFVMGGNTPSGLRNECFKYNVTANTWTAIAPLPSGRLILAGAVVGNFIYAIGGSDGTAYTSTTFKYDIAGNTWSQVADVPITIGWCRAVGYLDNYIYLAGGYIGTGNTYQNTVYLYDVTANTWSLTPNSMPNGVFGGAFGLTGDNTTLVYAGGALVSGITNTVMTGTIDGGNPSLITWVTMDNTYPGIGNDVRGKYDPDQVLAEILNQTTDATKHSIDGAIFPAGAIYRTHAATWGSDAIIMAGGTPTSDYVPADPGPCYIYTPSTDTWIAQENVPVSIGAHQSGSVHDGSTWKFITASGMGVGSVLTSATQIYTQTLGGATTFPLSVNVMDGWNMVSIPGLHPTNQNVNTWWSGRNPLADVYKWSGSYSSVTTATPSEGYWMLHSGANTYNTGDEYPAGGIQIVAHNPISVLQGWNMIGGYDLSVPIGSLTTTPPGQIVAGTIYGWNGSYFNPANLEPGYGYWVLLSSNAVINFPTLADATPKAVVEDNKEEWGKITLTDATGKSYVLYAVKGEVNLESYQLPPLPPSGMFDVRYGSGSKAEKLDKEMQTIEMRGITYPVKLRVEKTGIRVEDETGKIVNERLKSGEEITITNSLVSKLKVSVDVIPDKYALEQNYPNPFNPSTKIEFSIPEDVNNVTLTIYNALGQRVAELINSRMEAGKYTYVWNASDVATGLYIYELRTDKFVSVKKMMLLK